MILVKGVVFFFSRGDPFAGNPGLFYVARSQTGTAARFDRDGIEIEADHLQRGWMLTTFLGV